MRNGCLLFIFVTTLGAGCALPMSVRMQSVPSESPLSPDATQATVVFLRPGGGGANAILDEGGRALGEMPTPSKLVVKVDPGVHTFVKAVYKDPGNGDFTLAVPGEVTCHGVTGTFEANRIYFVEASLFRLFAVKVDDPRLGKWVALPTYRLDPAKAATAGATSDVGWSTCLEAAKRNLARGYKDHKSVVTAADGLSGWPG